MTWLLILAIWNTNPPQESFKFITESFETEADCKQAIQQSYAYLFNKGLQGQAICRSVEQLKLNAPMTY
jgi:hypothetical protein